MQIFLLYQNITPRILKDGHLPLAISFLHFNNFILMSMITKPILHDYLAFNIYKFFSQLIAANRSSFLHDVAVKKLLKKLFIGKHLNSPFSFSGI